MLFSLIFFVYVCSVFLIILDWEVVWVVWDVVICEMLLYEELFEKFIKFCNVCIFYFGYIFIFFDIQLSKMIKELLMELEMYLLIFERGIDFDVDNFELCYVYLEIFDEWFLVEDVLVY